MIQNKKSLMRVLLSMANEEESIEKRTYAIALLYLVNELIPDDRTTKQIIKNIHRRNSGCRYIFL